MLNPPAFFALAVVSALALAALCAPLGAQTPSLPTIQVAPRVDRVEPPNWWADSTINPVRVLLHGANLEHAQVKALGGGVGASGVRVSANGHYLFVNVALAHDAAPGPRSLRITTPRGTADAPFAVTPPLPTQGRFQGFSPDDVIYLLLPDRFSDGDPGNNDPAAAPGLFGRDSPRLYHGGDLQGIINHLPYLKDLGVTAIWITPIYQNASRSTSGAGNPPSADFHGYGATDFYAVDPHFGDMATLRELVDRAHALGLKVIQDQVANHVGRQHPWATDPPTPTWFHGSFAHHPANTFQVWTLMDPHATPQEQAGTLDGWFTDSLPDLNQDDPEVARYEIQNTLWWINTTGFDGIREDTLPYVPRAFWQAWSAAIRREHPRMTEVGEVFEGDAAQVAFFQGGRAGPDGVDTGIGSLFDYPLYYPLRRAFAQGASLEDIAEDEAHDWLFPNAGHLVTILGDHDVKRFLSEDGATPAGLMLADTFLLTTRGIPVIYYGDEIGMTGGDDPDNRRDFPGGFPDDPRDAFTETGRTPLEQEIFAHVRALTHLRAALPPLRRGSQKTLYLADQQWAYARILGSDSVLVALNNAHAPATFTVPVAALGWPDGLALADRLNADAPVRVDGAGAVTLTLPAQTGAVFTRQ